MLDWTDEQYDAYLRIRDSLDDAMHLLSGNEYKVLVFLLSRSLGQGQEAVALTLPEFHGEGQEAIGKTGLSRASIIRCIASLLAMGLISRTQGRLRDGFLYRVETDAIVNLTER